MNNPFTEVQCKLCRDGRVRLICGDYLPIIDIWMPHTGKSNCLCNDCRKKVEELKQQHRPDFICEKCIEKHLVDG